MRNHTTLSRQNLIEEIAHCVPEGHQVNLDNPMIFILVEVFKVRTIHSLLLLLLHHHFYSERMRSESSGGLLPSPEVQCHGDCKCIE